MASRVKGHVLLRAPDGASLKSKMVYASSKDAIKKKLTGEWNSQVCVGGGGVSSG